MGVTNLVVSAQVGSIVRQRHGGPDTAAVAQSHGPIKVLIPVGTVGAANIAHGTAIVVPPQQGFAKTGVLLKLVGQTAVAYHQAEFLRVAHAAYLVHRQLWRSPTGSAPVSRVVDESGTHTVAATHRGRVGAGAGTHIQVRHTGHDGGIVLEIEDGVPAMGTVDVVGDGIIHGGVGMGVAIVACAASIHSGHHHSTVQKSGVGKGILLIHQRLVHLWGQLRHILCRETSHITVGNIVARRPADIIEVGDMAGAGNSREGGYLCHVAHQQQIGGGRQGGGGTVILSVQIILYRGGGRPDGTLVGINNIRNKALALFPCHKVVQLAAERAVGHNQIPHRSTRAHTLGVETIERLGTSLE